MTLTIQAALPGTVLADGQTIPSPGESVVVKLLNDSTPNGDGNLTQFGSTGLNTGVSARPAAVRASSSASTTASTRRPARCVDPGARQPDPHPGHPGQPDHRAAARAGHHHLAPRRHRSARRSAASRCSICNARPSRRLTGRTFGRLTGTRADLDHRARRRRLHLHRRQLADRLQPDRPPRRQPDRQRRHQLHDADRDPGRRDHRQLQYQAAQTGLTPVVIDGWLGPEVGIRAVHASSAAAIPRVTPAEPAQRGRWR